MRDARLEAGRLQRMRHARARLEIVVVCIEAVLRLLPVRLPKSMAVAWAPIEFQSVLRELRTL